MKVSKKSVTVGSVLTSIFVLVNSQVAVIAAGENCYSIQNSDSKNFCLATAKNDPSYCYSIQSSDAKNMCLAYAKKEKSYCYSISNSDSKNQCLGQF